MMNLFCRHRNFKVCIRGDKWELVTKKTTDDENKSISAKVQSFLLTMLHQSTNVNKATTWMVCFHFRLPNWSISGLLSKLYQEAPFLCSFKSFKNGYWMVDIEATGFIVWLLASSYVGGWGWLFFLSSLFNCFLITGKVCRE